MNQMLKTQRLKNPKNHRIPFMNMNKMAISFKETYYVDKNRVYSLDALIDQINLELVEEGCDKLNQEFISEDKSFISNRLSVIRELDDSWIKIFVNHGVKLQRSDERNEIFDIILNYSNGLFIHESGELINNRYDFLTFQLELDVLSMKLFKGNGN